MDSVPLPTPILTLTLIAIVEHFTERFGCLAIIFLGNMVDDLTLDKDHYEWSYYISVCLCMGIIFSMKMVSDPGHKPSLNQKSDPNSNPHSLKFELAHKPTYLKSKLNSNPNPTFPRFYIY